MDTFEDLVKEAAASRRNVVVIGTPGPKREEIARSVHSLSSRAANPLVEIDCGQVAETFRAILPEILEAAHQGTLLLTGLDALSFDSQRDLMRAVETWEVQRPDGTRRIDVRYLATATPELHEAARASRFRLDLLYGLGGFMITVPHAERVSVG